MILTTIISLKLLTNVSSPRCYTERRYDVKYILEPCELFILVSERTLEGDEMPLQFPNRNKKTMIFLRIKVTLVINFSDLFVF